MLPNRPSPRNGGGLPGAPRSRSAGRSRQEEPSTNYNREQSTRSNGASSSRQVRSQRSMASMASSRDRSDPPPMPQPRQTSTSNQSSRAYEAPSMNRNKSDTSSSMSSTASSFLDRLRGSGDTSSRTSLEEEYELPKGRRGQESKRVRQDSSSSEEHDSEDPATTTGVGYTLWSRLASAAGTLGVDVGKAWSTDIVVQAGEETPPGQESRLTQAMKAYHLQKARDPSDLPEWLFEEHERRPVGRSRFASSGQDDGYEESPPAPRSRGLRDIYDAATAPPSASSRTPGSSDRSTPNRFADVVIASKATNRLKALRDAKRPNGRFDDDPPVKSTSDSDRREPGRRDGRVAEVADRKPPPRIGLPSGPGGGPRRI